MKPEIAKKSALFNKSFLQFVELIPPIATTGRFVIFFTRFMVLILAFNLISCIIWLIYTLTKQLNAESNKVVALKLFGQLSLCALNDDGFF